MSKSLNMSPLERRVLEAIVTKSRQQGAGWVGIQWIEITFREVPKELLLETCRELMKREVIKANVDVDLYESFSVVPTGFGTAYLKGYPISDGHTEVTLSFDHEILAQLLDAIAALKSGQVEVAAACREIAEGLRKPPTSTTADRIQAAIAILQAQPLFAQFILPMINQLR